jgi:hypothetical protein
MQAQRGQARRKILFEDFAVTPVLFARRAQAAAAVTAPFVQEYADATCGQRIGKRLVVAC